MTEYPGALDNNRRWFVFPTIFSQNSRGSELFWTIKVGLKDANTGINVLLTDELFEDILGNGPLSDNLYAVIKTDTGADGNVRKSDPTNIYAGKNLGKKNQTNAFTQALRDALGKYNKQLSNNNTELPRPMLATNIKDVDISSLKWPMYIQKKYDGIRAMTYIHEKKLRIYSRNIKPILGVPLSVQDEIVDLYKNASGVLKRNYSGHSAKELFFDGELYEHNVDLQDHGFLRQKEPVEDRKNLKYVIYDVFVSFDNTMPYGDRYNLLCDIFEVHKNAGQVAVVLAPTEEIYNYRDATSLRDKFLAMDYEGGILRVINSPYEQSIKAKHSKNLLKLKPRYSTEFIIIGYSGGESEGKEAGALMFTCRTSSGREFSLQPKGTIEERKKLFQEFLDKPSKFKKEYYGKPITVEYDDLSRDGIPLRAKAVSIHRRPTE